MQEGVNHGVVQDSLIAANPCDEGRPLLYQAQDWITQGKLVDQVEFVILFLHLKGDIHTSRAGNIMNCQIQSRTVAEEANILELESFCLTSIS